MSNLEQYRKQIYSCKQCSSCRQWDWWDSRLPGFVEGLTKSGFKICPVFSHSDGFQSDSPKGKIRLAKGIIDEQVAWCQEIADKVFQCTGCGNCTEHCPRVRQQKLDPRQVIIAMREAALSHGFSLPAGIKDERSRSVHALPIPESWISAQYAVGEVQETVFFPGCAISSNVSAKYPDIARDFVSILERSSVEFGFLRTGFCCGKQQLSVGQRAVAVELAKKNVEELRGLGTKTLVTTCAGCYNMFKIEYPRLLDYEMPFATYHASEYLLRLAREGKLKLQEKSHCKVTYHDPCDLGRHSGVFDAPRSLITSVRGVELVEMVQNRENAMCCGAGGGMKSSNPDMALNISVSRIHEAEQTGASAVVTACPSCRWSLEDAAAALGSKLAIMDIVDFIHSALTD